jgi:hypothetical protein
MYTPIIDIMKTTSKYQHGYDKFLLSSDKISDFVLHISVCVCKNIALMLEKTTWNWST